MTSNLEVSHSQEINMEDQINDMLIKSSKERQNMKGDVPKARSPEEMEEYLKSGELEKRVKEYVKINGENLTISKIEMDKSGLLKMTYKVKFGGVEKDIATYFQIVGKMNNTYLQFKKSPNSENIQEVRELYEDNGEKKLRREEKGVYNGGIMYDVNIVKDVSKGIDIRVVENLRKTEEKRLEAVKTFELTPEFKDTDFEDASLENTKITALKDTKLGKEITKEENGYSRAIFMKEGEKYREIGKIYFNEKGQFDTKKTAATQEFKILGVKLEVTVNTKDKTFNFKNIDKLKEQIKEHRKILTTYIQNATFGDEINFPGFNKPKGAKRTQTKLLGLKLTDDMYTFKRGGDKEIKTLNFGFTDTNELILKDIAGKTTEAINIEIKGKKGGKEIAAIKAEKKDKKENNALIIIDPANKELITNQEKPELKHEPAVLKAKDNVLYNQNDDFSKLEYHNKKGEFLSKIPASKNEKNEWKLAEVKETVNPEDLYKNIKKSLLEKDKNMDQRVKNLNLLDNDIYAAFVALLEKHEVKLTERPVVKVLDDEKNGIYKYYKVEQKNDGDPLVFEEDKDLYEDAEDVMDEVLKNMAIIEKIENIKMAYKDKGKGEFTQSVGSPGLLPIETQSKIKFLQNNENTEIPLVRTFILGVKTEEIQKFDITFNIKDTKITANEKQQIINNKKYKTRLDEKNDALILWFDEIK